jgi:hypothetical protein
MNRYRAQGIADEVSRACKCVVSAKIRELLTERGAELPLEKLDATLTKVGDFIYSEVWRSLAGEVQTEEGGDR